MSPPSSSLRITTPPLQKMTAVGCIRLISAHRHSSVTTTSALGEVKEFESERSRILEFVIAHPGSHFRRIRKEIALSMGTVQYHLHLLEKQGKIVSDRRSLLKRFYPAFGFEERDKEIMNVLLNETQRDVLLHLLLKGEANHSEISEHMHLSASTLNWHMKRLKAAGLIQTRREGRSVHYLVPGEIGTMCLLLLRSNQPNVWARWTDRFANILG